MTKVEDRRGHTLNISHTRLESYQWSFFPDTTRLWNNLPIDLVILDSLEEFITEKITFEENNCTTANYYSHWILLPSTAKHTVPYYSSNTAIKNISDFFNIYSKSGTLWLNLNNTGADVFMRQTITGSSKKSTSCETHRVPSTKIDGPSEVTQTLNQARC